MSAVSEQPPPSLDERRPTGHRTRTTVVSALVAVTGIRVATGSASGGGPASLVEDPGGVLGRSLDGWSTAGTLGGASAADLRAVPLAALHRSAELVGLPSVVAHATWVVLVLVLAVVGARRLAAVTVAPRAGRHTAAPGGPDDAAGSWAPWVAAVVYACGPVLVVTSVEAPLDGLVAAVLPWVLLPVVRRDEGWAGAARSAAWLGLAGVATLAWSVLVLAAAAVTVVAVWRTAPRQILRWTVLAALASAWWATVAVWELRHATAVTAVLPDAGPSQLLAESLGRPSWALGWLLLVLVGPLAVAVAGLVLAPVRDRRVVVLSLVLLGALPALALLTGAWRFPVTASAVQDGSTAALAPTLAVWGVAAVLAWTPVTEHLRWRIDDLARPPRTAAQAGSLLAAVAVGAGCLGAVVTPLERPAEAAPAASGTTSEELWRSVAAWSRTAPAGRVLVLPATTGRLDPVVGRALRGRSWVGRDSVPVSGPEATAALDDVLQRVARGQAGTEVVDALRRAGVAYVLVRDDLGAAADRRNPSALVRASLLAGDATRVATIAGPDRGDPEVVVDGGLRPPRPQVEVWSVPGASVARVGEGSPLEVAGGPGATTDLAASGLLGPRVVRLRDEAEDVVSDSAYRRDVDQRQAVDPDGPALAAGQPRRVVPPGAAPAPTAVRRLDGAQAVTASSSAAEAAGGGRQAGAEPRAAVDGNAFTVWRSQPGAREGEWWELRLDAPVPVAGTTVQVVQNLFGGQVVTRVRVDTDAGGREVDVPPDGLLTLDDPVSTSRLRITAVAFSGSARADAFGIAEVTVPGVTVRDDLVVRRTPAASWVLATRPGSQVRCVPAAGLPTRPGTSGPTVCDPSLTVPGRDAGPMDRVLDVPGPVTLAGRAWVRAADTAQAAVVADGLARPSVAATGSSVAAQDLVTRPQSAADGDPATAWRAAPSDEAPTVTLAWQEATRVRGVRLQLVDDGVSSRPTRVRVDFVPAGPRRGAAPRRVVRPVDDDGAVSFPAVRARGVTLTLLDLEGPTSVDSSTGAERPSAAALAEVVVEGAPATTYDADAVRTLPCGQGPVVDVDGESVATTVRTSARDLTEGRPVAATLCERPALTEGEHPVSLEASFTWLPLGLVLSSSVDTLGDVDDDRPAGTGGGALLDVDLDELADRGSSADLTLPGSGTRTVVLAVPEGTGWDARATGADLRPVTVDGWAQGWVVPEGVERVSLAYSAGGSLRLGVGVGLLGWLAVLGLGVALGVLPRARRRRDQSSVGRSTQA